MLAPRYDLPDTLGHFGPYGGVFVAETLIPALEELNEAYALAQRDPLFIAEFEYDLKHYVGRPSPIYHARRWSDPVSYTHLDVYKRQLCNRYVETKRHQSFSDCSRGSGWRRA